MEQKIRAYPRSFVSPNRKYEWLPESPVALAKASYSAIGSEIIDDLA
jgi:hypothetical protein